MLTEHDTSAEDSVLIIGASTRAAAFSARRAGLNPVCADLFADRDLQNCFPITRLAAPEFPHGFERIARSAAPGPWLYVGALENHPELVARIAAARPLWGNGAEVLRRVRDPFQLAECLAAARLPYPRVRPISDTVAADATWLLKPLSSAGGRGIRVFTGWNDSLRKRAVHGMYWQQRLSGLPCAAIFVADRRRAVLIGLTSQLIGEHSFHAKPFHYCGSIGPLPIGANLRAQLNRIGNTIADEFRLIGLFGVDGMLIEPEFWPIEVNPRYTASVEILELGMNLPAMALHRDVCRNGVLTWGAAKITQNVDRRSDLIGKAILFAAEPVQVPAVFGEEFYGSIDSAKCRWPIPFMADLPQPGQNIPAGAPICTVFAVHSSIEACRRALSDAAQMIYAQLEMRKSPVN